jgi:hypothetical protein
MPIGQCKDDRLFAPTQCILGLNWQSELILGKFFDQFSTKAHIFFQALIQPE